MSVPASSSSSLAAVTATARAAGPPPAPKILSYVAILTLAANTMNGPGMTTLPNVATDAGLFLYVILIIGSVMMASYVCRRMVFAMWSSVSPYPQSSYDYEGVPADAAAGCDNCKNGEAYQYNTVENTQLQQKRQQYSTLESVGTKKIRKNALSISAADDFDNNDDIDINLLHVEGPSDEYFEEKNDNREEEELIHHQQPILERTSIVGQSLEAYGNKISVYVAFTMVASALCLALAQMMLCAAILDGMLVSLFGQTCALGGRGGGSWIHCTSHSSMKPYAGSEAPTSLISIGTVIAAVISVAMGTVDLDEMMTVQYLFFACLIVSCARFAYVLRKMSIGLSNVVGDNLVDVLGGVNGDDFSWFVGPNPFSTIGPIMFNFAFVVTAPPLVAMAKTESVAYKALGMACVVMGVLYTMVGCIGAPVANAVRNGLVDGGDDTNLLSLILLSGDVGPDGGSNRGHPSIIDLFCIGTFGLSTVASVPVYCLLAKDTLVNDAGVAPIPAFLLSNVLPWLLVMLTYNASFFEAFVNWSGLLILGYSNFSLPLLLDIKLKQVRAFLRKGIFSELSVLDGSPTKKTSNGESAQTTKIASAVFSFLTASISFVIAISITSSVVFAGLSFVGVVVVTFIWPNSRRQAIIADDI